VRKAEGLFFFEKKNQKTLFLGRYDGAAARQNDRSFLLLFFKKEVFAFRIVRLALFSPHRQTRG